MSSLYQLQEHRGQLIQRLCNEYTWDRSTIREMDLEMLESELSELKKLWEKFESTHEKILESGKILHQYLYYESEDSLQVVNNYTAARFALLKHISALKNQSTTQDKTNNKSN